MEELGTVVNVLEKLWWLIFVFFGGLIALVCFFVGGLIVANIVYAGGKKR